MQGPGAEGNEGAKPALSRILVVEESILVAMEIEEELAARGFTVELAGSLLAAEERMRGRTFAAALLDCHLPDGHVLEIALRLADAGCPVAIVTGSQADSLPDGFGKFPRFQKPVPARTLAKWVMDTLAPC